MKIKLISPFIVIQNNKAVALLVALFSLTLSVWVATEISYDSNVEYILSSRKLHKLQAYYAAKSGIKISLLRIYLFKKVQVALSSKPDIDSSQFNSLWSFPLAWPPSLYLSSDISTFDKEQFKKEETKSFIKAQYTTSISPEDNKIDINDLLSPSKLLSEFSKTQLINIFKSEVETNTEFAKQYRDYNFTELANNFIDWIDKDSVSLNGGDESSYYSDWADKNKHDQDSLDYIPANQSFKHISELRMISGMNDDFFQLLEDKITLFGSKKINLNHIDSNLLKSFPWATPEIISAFEERLASQNFVNKKDFKDFLQTFDLQNKVDDFIFSFGSGVNYQISSTGIVKDSSYSINVITYDIQKSRQRLEEILFFETQKNNAEEGKKKQVYKKDSYFLPNKSPVVVHWQEF